MVCHLRAALRLVLLVLIILVLAVSWLLPPLVGLVSPGAKARLRVRQMHAWGRATTWVMGVRVTREGPVPQAPFFLVTNHLSYLDIPVMFSQVQSYFVAKKELGSWPLLGPLIRAAGTVFVDRTKARGVLPAIDAVRSKLELGCGALVFPEGTSSSGEALLPLRSNFFEVPATMGIPVHVGCIRYWTDDPRHPPREHVAWWGDATFGDHFWRVLGMRRVYARVRFAARTAQGEDRKALAADVGEVMRTLFEPVPEA